jgi:exopolysaccharide production protein ExoQ
MNANATIAGSPSSTVAVNVPEVLAFIALAALIFEPLLGSAAAACFLGAGLLLILLPLSLGATALLRWWFLLVLPAYCVLSTLWSQFPFGTFRYALQLGATMAIAVAISNRVTLRGLLRALFLSLLAGTAICIVFGRVSPSGAWLGMFASKNGFAAHLALQALVSLAVLLDSRETRVLRLLALAGTVASLPLMLLAQSAGVIVAIGPCIVAMLLVVMGRHVTGPQKLFFVGLACLAAVGVIAAVVLFGDILMAELLESTGKDVTLTGRTDLWQIGLDLVSQNPIFGLGYRAFWVQGYDPAERIWAMFHVPSGSGFSFHNTYISNAVELGLIGIGLQVVMLYAPLAVLLWLAVLKPDIQVAGLMGMHLFLLIRSFIEVEVFFEFGLRTVLAVCTFVYAAHMLDRLPRRKSGGISTYGIERSTSQNLPFHRHRGHRS